MPRKDGIIAIIVNTALADLKKNGIKTGLVPLIGKEIQGCTAYGKCIMD